MTPRELLDWAGYLAFKPWPPIVGSHLGASLAQVARLSIPAAHRDATNLITGVRPDWAAQPGAVEAAARRLWANVGRLYGEVPGSHDLVRKGRVTIDDPASLDATMASGRPVILLFVHTGNWELSGIDFACRYPGRITAIYDPPRRRSQAVILLHERRKMPAKLVPVSRMVWRQSFEALRRPGGILWISADEFAYHIVQAPFFGRAPRINGNLGKIVRLALRTDAIVAPFYCERHPGLRFTSHILPPMRFEGDAADDAAVLEAVKAIDKVIGPPVARLIDQWFMGLIYRDFAAPPEA